MDARDYEFLSKNLILPVPTYTPPNQSKKSHARKQPVGHIPRPRNAFILFRCDFVRQKKIPESVENDHRNISRIVGKIWQQMSPLDKDPWMKMAEQEKSNHFRMHPGYKFGTGVSNRKKTRQGDDMPREIPDDELSLNDALYLALQRAASCPPGTLHVPRVNLEHHNGHGTPLRTRDDLSRRPSRVTFYQSTPCDLDPDVQLQDSTFFENVGQTYNTLAMRDDDTVVNGINEDPFVDSVKLEHEGMVNGNFCEPRLNTVRCLIPGYDFLPEWENIQYEGHIFSDSYNPDHNSGEWKSYFKLPPIFIDPLLSTLPPLPRSNSNLPFPLEGCQSVSGPFSESFFRGASQGYGFTNQPSQLFDLDDTVAGQYTRDLADNIIQDFSQKIMGAPPDGGY